MVDLLNTKDPTQTRMPKVTVIVACRNEEEFLHKCLLSLLKQDYPQELLEILVIDGMSTDKTWAVGHYFEEMYPNVKVDVNPKRFKYPGLNQGIKRASGEFIAIADAHSTYPKTYLSKLVEWLRLVTNFNVMNAGCGRIFVPRKDTALGRAITLAQTEAFSCFK